MKIGIIVAIVFILLIPIGTEVAFAQSDTITIKHWFISSYDFGCSAGNKKALEFYEKLTLQYLLQFDVKIIQTKGECVSNRDVVNELGEFTGDISPYVLPIIILDQFSSKPYAIEEDAYGHYQYYSEDFDHEAIVFGSFSKTDTESEKDAWTLSHELSHFILRYEQQSRSIWADWVHNTQTKYDYCKDKQQCPELWTTVTAPSGKQVKMMNPYRSVIFPTFITMNSFDSQPSYGETSSISGKLLNPDTGKGIANKKLKITAVSSSGSVITLSAPISNYDGTFSTKLQFNESGTWAITVNFEGDLQYTSTVSDMTLQITNRNIPQNEKNYDDEDYTSNKNPKISIIIDPVNTQPSYGTHSYISGKLLNPDTNQGIANKKLNIKAITPSGSILVLANGISDKDGLFSTKLQFHESGTWKIIVNFDGDLKYAPIYRDLISQITVSKEQSVSIPKNSFERIETFIYLENVPSIKIGNDVVFKGRLFYESSGLYSGVPFAKIDTLDDLMPYYPPHQEPFMGGAVTDQNGNFEFTWVARENPTTITSQGSVWTPKAYFGGTEKFQKSYDGMGLGSFIVFKPIIDEKSIPDSDNDGIIDDYDSCPNQPETFNGSQDVDGCADSISDVVHDADGDKILDEFDRCPTLLEKYNDILDNDGCPDSINDSNNNFGSELKNGNPVHVSLYGNNWGDNQVFRLDDGNVIFTGNSYDKYGKMIPNLEIILTTVEDQIKINTKTDDKGNFFVKWNPVYPKQWTDTNDAPLIFFASVRNNRDIGGGSAFISGDTMMRTPEFLEKQELENKLDKQELAEQRLEEKKISEGRYKGQEKIEEKQNPKEQFCFLFWCW
ncbi:MAG: hypothetical protein HOD60_12850 [Candidatus Nitrosopelagicus sp.]|nr:hypothetical protein [Candidatus Nitrosopelagicus sp.]